MINKTPCGSTRKNGEFTMKTFFFRYGKLHIWFLCAAAAVVLFHGCKHNRRLMNAVAEHVTQPIKQALGALCALAPFSVAEVLLFAAAGALILYLAASVGALVRRRDRGAVLYGRTLGLVCAALTIYAAFCLLWGVNYYTDDFQTRSGIHARQVSQAELYQTTAYFVDRLNETAGFVPRDEEGVFAVARSTIYDNAVDIYRGVEAAYPFLTMKDRRPKAIMFSRLMSETNFTGFFFPFTGEANLNNESPACLLPSTIAHEMAHQRGIASEQECNFLAVLTCELSGNAAYEYSGWLMGFIHLSNALYSVDPEGWAQLHGQLSETVQADLRDNNAYWAQFESKTAEVSQDAYDQFLKSYGESSGIQSYGAVVDLLVAYYGGAAAEE